MEDMITRGTCQVDNCPFSHLLSKEKMPVCRFFLKGNCAKDEKCPYLHVNVGPNAPVCDQFISGYCSAGDQCQLQHIIYPDLPSILSFSQLQMEYENKILLEEIAYLKGLIDNHKKAKAENDLKDRQEKTSVKANALAKENSSSGKVTNITSNTYKLEKFNQSRAGNRISKPVEFAVKSKNLNNVKNPYKYVRSANKVPDHKPSSVKQLIPHTKSKDVKDVSEK